MSPPRPRPSDGEEVALGVANAGLDLALLEGGITVEYEVSTDPASYVPPPDGWQWAGCVMAGDGACMVEKLLVRGFARRQAPTWLFRHRGERNRQDLSHEEDIAGIIERCRPHGITVEAGEVYDETDCVRMDRPFRVFRHSRMTGEGCPWDPAEPFDHCFMIVDGKTPLPGMRARTQARLDVVS